MMMTINKEEQVPVAKQSNKQNVPRMKIGQ